MGRKGVFGVRWFEGRVCLVIPLVNGEQRCRQALGYSGGTRKSKNSAALLNNSWMPRRNGAGAPLHNWQVLPCLPCLSCPALPILPCPTEGALAAFRAQVCLAEGFPCFVHSQPRGLTHPQEQKLRDVNEKPGDSDISSGHRLCGADLLRQRAG